MQLIDFFDRGALHHASRPFLIEGEQSLSHAEVSRITHAVAHGLRAAGLGVGQMAAVYSPNNALAFAATLGIFRSGAAWVPLNARNALDENLHILRANDCELLFIHSQFISGLELVRAQVPSLRHVICVDQETGGVDSFDRWITKFQGPSFEAAAAAGDIAAIFSTGGTTGRPKGVMLTHQNCETMIANGMSALAIDQPPVHLIAAPMTHAAGVVAFTLMAFGATNIVLKSADPAAILECVETHGITTLFLPPTSIYALLEHPDLRRRDLRSLQHLIYAAAPMSTSKLKRALEVFGPILIQSYGQAEAPMFCTSLSRQEHLAATAPELEHRLASCGRVAPFTRLAIMDEQGNFLARGEPGEIVVRGHLVMKGYYKNPDATAEVSAYGWHHTGDIGYLDDDGYVYIIDRKKDLIISGGFNVYPGEVEQALWSHPAVQDCAVIGVPDEKWGEAVRAIVELKPGARIAPEELIAFCKERVGSVKAPKVIELWASLPRSAVGKVLKRDIRERFWAGQSRKI